eukprot:gene11046-biopygen9004
MTEPGRNMTKPGRNIFSPPGRRTELAPSSRTEDGVRGRRTGRSQISGSQDGGRSRPQIPFSRTEDGASGNSVLRSPGRNIFSAASSRTEDGILKLAPSSRTTPGRRGHLPRRLSVPHHPRPHLSTRVPCLTHTLFGCSANRDCWVRCKNIAVHNIEEGTVINVTSEGRG